MSSRVGLIGTALVLAAVSRGAAEEPVLTPKDAASADGKKCVVEFRVRIAMAVESAKDRYVFLNSNGAADVTDPDSITVIIPEETVKRFRAGTMAKLVGELHGKTVRVSGTVKREAMYGRDAQGKSVKRYDRSQITLTDPKQLVVVEEK